MAAVNDLITENIDIWTSAVKRRSSAGRGGGKKIELYGVRKLRELILDLAIRGLLVPQDQNDEPAKALLERIAAEKAKQERDNTSRKTKTLSSISDEEKPFCLPMGWEWTRLGMIGTCSTGKTPSTKEPSFFDGETPFIGPGQITNDGRILPSDKHLSPDGIANSTTAKKGDLLMVCIGGSIGKSVICNEEIAFNQQINSVRPIFLDTAFLKSVISSNYFQNSVLKNSRGSATPIINRSKWEELPVPICSKQEQHRIVAKADELMALCDLLEQQTESSFTAHQTLVQTLLGTLTQAAATQPNTLKDARAAPTPFIQAWNRLAEHFDTVFTTEDSIEQLKQTILQLAVMGKLVPQDPNDEPASELLKRIAGEKTKLLKAKKIKKQKALPAISEDEEPFALPFGWEWTRVGNISSSNGGFAYKSKQFVTDSQYQVIRMGNIRPDFLRINENPVFIELAYASSTQDYEIAEGDILLTMTGTKGKRDYLYSLLVSDKHLAKNRLFLNQRLCIIRPISVVNNYINSVLKDNRLLDATYAKSTGSANQANIGMEAISEWIIPLPPLSQQRRIVAKIEELMSICEYLKARLTDAQATQLQLADAVTEQAIN